MKAARPSLLVSTVAVTLLTLLWGWLRLFAFRESVLPLTFVLPLLLCIWTGRRWQIWTMAAVFAGMITVKMLWMLPPERWPPHESLLFLGATLVNILVGAIVVQAILAMRENLEARHATIAAQNAELEAQAEELSQQNEELKAQAEELAEQNEEIEAQSEEVTRQNEDLIDLNTRLTGREAILESVLQSTRSRPGETEALDVLCARTLAFLGAPAVEVAILECDEDGLMLRARAGREGQPLVPARWPIDGSLAGVVLRERRTAYVSELRQRADLAQPFDATSPVQSLLATPLLPGGEHTGLLVACGVEPAHWTDEQFRIVEWIAAQCGLLLEALRNQEALAEHAAALEAANQSKDRFLAMLSHELRTPLTPVLALAGTLENDPRLPDDIRDDLRMVRRNVGIQSRLIDDLLDLTRISRGKVELDRQVLQVGALLRDTASIVAADVAAKAQELRLELDGARHCALLGDGPRLQQVFWNLLKNAIKFSPQGARIEMRGAVEDGELRVVVRDSGVGIGKEDVERIFLPFEQRLTGPRRASESGLGLGLAIAKAVVEMHGGRIGAQSEGEGRGAAFSVTLPLVAAADVPPAVAAPSAGEAAAPGEPLPRLLLVEDHSDTGKVLARLLRRAGYEVARAETAADGLRLFQESRFDLIVSDLGLPDESGLELMRKLRALDPAVRGICMSGYGMEDDVTASRAAGFAAHLTKPIDVDRLTAAIKKCSGKAA